MLDMLSGDDLIFDGCAGPGGWSEGISWLGLHDVGFEWDSDACATRLAAGHQTIQADVSTIDLTAFAGRVRGLIFSPPCTLFSTAGSKKGRNANDILAVAMAEVAKGNDVREQARLDAAEAIYEAEAETIRGTEWEVRAQYAMEAAANACLVLEPARWAVELNPEWIALEQVPAVLPLWEAMARGLKMRGYSVWTGILNAADYGVPQTRKRAFLMASRVRAAHPPEATHDRDPQPSLFGEAERWVSMAKALGWDGNWQVGFPRRDDTGQSADGYRERDWFDDDEPAPVLTEKARSWERRVVVTTGANSMVTGRTGSRAGDGDVQPYQRSIDEPAPTVDRKVGGAWRVHEDEAIEVVGLNPGLTPTQPNRRIYGLDEPAPAVAFGHDSANWKWVSDEQPGGEEPTHLDRRADYKGGVPGAPEIPTDQPAPTLTSKALDSVWQWRNRRNDQSESGESDPDWPLDRPATTIVGRGLVPDPGTNANRFNGAAKSRNDGYRISVDEAAVLQSFRRDYPWRGSRTSHFVQVGNAVPPRIACHVVAALTGLPLPDFSATEGSTVEAVAVPT